MIPRSISLAALRQIALCGDNFHLKWLFSGSPTNFPCTEELSLEHVEWDADFQWPNFPRLRALRLALCHSHSAGPITLGTFPALRTLEMVRCVFAASSIPWLRLHASSLESLIILGNELEVDFPKFDFTPFTRLRHLVFDPRSILSLTMKVPDFTLSTLPTSLTTLAIFAYEYLTTTEHLIRDALIRAFRSPTSFPSLKQLYLEGDWRSLFPELRHLCAMRNVEIKFFLRSYNALLHDAYSLSKVNAIQSEHLAEFHRPIGFWSVVCDPSTSSV
ncbi:hypothetical protein JAAARDRAFT_41851 [Jaapia argillacea MUCL 33604]|uniref:F-box domain-containing protein n=1 Tax=Jaapia argillacea MUCL 33604 TaxID=933084 RepID=A0A067PIB7_9AGAM|nr:hypothetical protein JAAARDRAFT_41851 [Jaapia argillacea MUCL 33604]